MARHERLSVGKLELAKDKGGTVVLEQAFVAGGTVGAAETLKITTTQAVESIGTFTGSHKLKININGVEYWISLDAV
jgi:hypothetical protein